MRGHRLAGCNGALTELYEILGEKLKRRAYPGWFAAWPDKEAQARRLRSFELVVVPGLLQTEAYARAVLSTRVGATEDEIDEAVAARLARQKILEREHPPELWVILDEGVLRRPVGGSEVMQGQLVNLAGMACRPHIVVQVVPHAAGAHQGLDGGAFAIADFDDATTIAYQDTAVSGQIIEDAAEADALAHTWDTLRLEAVPRAASLSLMRKRQDNGHEPEWRKATYSSGNGGNCIVATADRTVAVRDSKDPDGPRLAFRVSAWQPFAAKIKGERSLASWGGSPIRVPRLRSGHDTGPARSTRLAGPRLRRSPAAWAAVILMAGPAWHGPDMQPGKQSRPGARQHAPGRFRCAAPPARRRPGSSAATCGPWPGGTPPG